MMNKAVQVLVDNGYNIAFVSSSVDGVSYDVKFVQSHFLSFLRGHSNYFAHTDTNHYAKNRRYKTVYGGNTMKTIDVVLIDSGASKAAGVT